MSSLRPVVSRGSIFLFDHVFVCKQPSFMEYVCTLHVCWAGHWSMSTNIAHSSWVKNELSTWELRSECERPVYLTFPSLWSVRWEKRMCGPRGRRTLVGWWWNLEVRLMLTSLLISSLAMCWHCSGPWERMRTSGHHPRQLVKSGGWWPFHLPCCRGLKAVWSEWGSGLPGAWGRSGNSSTLHVSTSTCLAVLSHERSVWLRL